MFKQGSGFRRGRSCLWLARGLLGSLIYSTCISLDAAAAPSEGELRAAVIVAIMRFTSWEAVPAEQPVLDVCLVGNPVSAAVLMSVSGEQKVATRTLNVRPVTSDVDSCQVMVIGEDIDDDEYEQLIALTDGQSILTVCDGCQRGLGEDAIIQLRLRQQRVSFEVNLTRARSNNVALDAQLLELAAVVRR
jgi:hypothetical protein